MPQNNSSQPIDTSEWENREIVRIAVTALDLTLPSIHLVACTWVQHGPQQKTERAKFLFALTIMPLISHACTLSSLESCSDYHSPQQGIVDGGAMSFDNQTPLVVISGTLTAQWYIVDILQLVVLPYLLRHPELTFQHNTARDMLL